MKPNFALNLSDTGIALLHRTAKGWALVGETPFDAPDLAEALDYLRKTALDLEPGGISTKVVIPNSQILYAEVAAPGPSEQDRRDQISAELEGRTPYKPDEIAFDFSGRGKQVKVAAVARETLAEAEAFATEHRFNPVSFVAIPEGNYSGEPWFGPTEAAKTMLAPGEVVERDRSAIALPGPRVAEKGSEKASETAEDEASEEAGDTAGDRASEKMGETGAGKTDTLLEAVAKARTESLPGSAARAEDKPKAPFPASTAPAMAAADPEPASQAKAPPMSAPVPPAPAAAPAKMPDPAPAGAEAAAKPDAAPVAAPAAASADFAPRARVEPAPVPPPPPLGATPGNAAAGPVEEAPFTHVADPEIAASAEDDLPPMPANAGAAARLASGRPLGIAAASLPNEEDDLPPMPSAAALAAFGRRRGAEGPGASDPGGAPSLPAASLPAASRPDAAALARAARGKPIEDLPPVPRPAAAPAPAVPTAATARAGLDPLVKSPGIAGARKGKPKQTPAVPAARAPAIAATAPSASDAARSLSRSPFASPPRKPRHLGLILTAILLLCLALVAAWSSLYLASAQDPAAPAVALAEDPAPEAAGTADVPTIEDEMLADAQDPEELAALPVEDEGAAADVTVDLTGEADLADPAADAQADAGADGLALSTAEEGLALATPGDEAGVEPGVETGAQDTALTAESAPEAAPEAAPETGLATDTPAAVALVDAQDEIFLAASDAPPPAFDALSLPAPDATADAMPAPPMPPPPPGTVYRFDANGLIVPTPEGIPSPAGFMLFAGKPDLLPPARSALAEEAATRAAADLAAADAAAAAPAEAALAASPAAAAPTVPVPAGPEAQPDPDLADRRPRERPADLAPATAEDDAALDASTAPQFASLRPRARPSTVLAAGERARAETAGASIASPSGDAVIEPAALSAADADNPSLLAISRRPAEKPQDFSRAVEAAVAAAVRAPEPEPEPIETASAKAPAGKAKPDEQAEIDEPEPVASAAPKIPTKASVAKQATFKNAINLSKTNLIGVYGTQSKRYALIRQSNGRYKKVKVGDRIDGGTVQAITQTEVRYQKGGRLMVLAMPRG
jgi:hypothetical protein